MYYSPVFETQFDKIDREIYVLFGAIFDNLDEFDRANRSGHRHPEKCQLNIVKALNHTI